MAQFQTGNSGYTKQFLVAGLLLLVAGLLFGITGAMQYIFPGFLKGQLSFERVRPLHVTSVVFWILLAATGSALTYLQQHTGRKLFSKVLLRLQFYVFITAVLLMLSSYCYGIFGGREYWEFHPLLALPVIAGWILFLANILLSAGSLKNQPVYVWMWVTGAVFFLFTYLESNLWLIPYFSKHLVKDMTIQWKSYGSMVGSWNMIIYGSSIFLMGKISGGDAYSRSATSFALYFTGLFNLMFNWGHHIYTLPAQPYVQYISYAVSMTELFIFGRIIFLWKTTVGDAQKYAHQLAYRFLLAADIWIFLTLLLAIIMSVPAVNVYTHGTHVTVAHTMGATIGINSMLLLAFAADILEAKCYPEIPNLKWVNRGNQVINISLFVFWLSLIMAGIIRARWQMSAVQGPFSSMMLELRPYFITFFLSGLTMFSGFVLCIYPLLKGHLACYFKTKETGNEFAGNRFTPIQTKNN